MKALVDNYHGIDPSLCNAASWENLPPELWKKVAERLDEKSLQRLACCSTTLLDRVGWQPGSDLSEDQRFFEMALGWLQEGLLQQLDILPQQLLTMFFPKTYKAIEIRYNHGFEASFISNIMPPVCQSGLAWQRRAGAQYGCVDPVDSIAREPEVYNLHAAGTYPSRHRELFGMTMTMEQLLNYTKRGPRAQYSMFTLETGKVTSCRIVHQAIGLMRQRLLCNTSQQFSVNLWSSTTHGTQHPYNMSLTRRFYGSTEQNLNCSKQRHQYAYLICVSRSGDGLLDFLCSNLSTKKRFFSS